MIIAREGEIKKMFEKNMQQLPPYLRQSVMQIDEHRLWEKVTVTYNDEGVPTCRYYEGNASFRITGKRPVREAAQWCESISYQGSGAIFMYGCGFGYPLFALFEHKQPHSLVVLFEKDVYLFAAMLYYFDLEPIIRTGKIAFLIGEIPDFAAAFDRLFFSIVFADCTAPALAFTLAAQRNFKADYLKIHKYVFAQLGLLVFYIGNDHLDNLIGFHNLLANINEIVKNPYLSSLQGQYRDVPAFIIANGPSLDKNMHRLKDIKGKGLIISTESAVIPLLKNGIKPDILTIIERTPYTYTYHFENVEYPEDIALLSLALVDKRVYPAFPGEIIPIFRKNEAINEWINKYTGDGTSLDAGANVSHLAFELAVYLGADPIVFVGQDYAYGPAGVTHSKDAVYLEEKGKRARDLLQSKPVVYVESNEGNQIPSNQLWADFKRGLERKIAAYPQKKIINATEGGAKIEGCRYEQLAAVIKQHCRKPIHRRVNEIIAENRAGISISERKEGLKQLIASAAGYARLFRNLSKETAAGKLACKEMMRLSEDGDSAKCRQALEETYQENVKIYRRLLADDLCRCFSQQVIFSYFYLINRLGFVDTPEKARELFRIHYHFLHHLNIVCQSVSIHLENAVQLLERTMESLEHPGGQG